MNKEELMYKELKTVLEDKRILEELISSEKERIKYIIQKELGLHATTYSELKIHTSRCWLLLWGRFFVLLLDFLVRS